LLLGVTWPASKDVQLNTGFIMELQQRVTSIPIRGTCHLDVFEIPREDQRNIKSITTGTVHAVRDLLLIVLVLGQLLKLPDHPGSIREVWTKQLLIFVSLLKALTIKVPNVNSGCSPERITLTAKFNHDKYVPKTDGEILHSNKRVQAILEVKPTLRFNLKLEVQMQESAEMVAWIMNDDRVPGANLTGRYVFHQYIR
jgi:hypothetical protein